MAFSPVEKKVFTLIMRGMMKAKPKISDRWRRWTSGWATIIILVFMLVAGANICAAEDVWTGVERIVAVGDVHGDYENFIAVLRFAGIIDDQGNWSGGKTHLVQVGDILDRGPEPRKVMDLLMKLEPQARKAGGYIHPLIGNHEAMNVYGDLRYVSPSDYASFQIEGSQETEPKHPAGYAERLRQFGPDGKYGKWIRSHNAVIKINDTIFLHGGISPKYASYSIRQINDRIREELENSSKLPGGMVMDEEGPLWYRGMARGDEQALEPLVATVLKNLQAERIVIGHTFADGAVTPRLGGKILMIDIGLARLYDTFIRQACLVIENGKPYALHRGTRLELPSDNGKDMLRYLQAAAALDPQPSSLEKRIASLQSRLATDSKP